jgi:hypothetical protein
MLRLSAQAFRIAIGVTLAVLALVVVLPLSGFVSYPKEVEAARLWNYYGATLPVWPLVICWGATTLLIAAGLVGAFFFWSPSRWLLLASVILSLLWEPFAGLLVLSATEAFVLTLFSYLVIAVLTVSFFSPLAERFNRHVRT